MFYRSYFAFFALYLCSGGTWVHVVAKKDLLKLDCVCRVCCALPMFWWYLGTYYDRKGITWVDSRLRGLLPLTCVLVVLRYMLRPKSLLELICIYGGFYDLPVFRWYLGSVMTEKELLG